jgi:hypothetical protein
MDHPSHARPATAPEPSTLRARGLIRRIYTANPFYVISADLVFIGLRMSFDTSGKTFETWALMIGLAGYTLLLAATACLLIRSCRVWDDVRTLLLLVVLMFLATSVTFDDTLASNPGLGRACFVGGFVFAAAVSEAVLRVIRLSLPALLRVPYYLILALFFLYPMAVSPFVGDPDGPALQWALWGFSPTAGLVFLTLLPAARSGPESVVKNGSPWRWPLYPWVLFAVLGLGVCARANYLCTSLHFVGGTGSIFGPYFLVPFLLAVDLLILERGIVTGNRAKLRMALAMPVVPLALSLAWHRPDPIYERFLAIFVDGVGASPLFLTLAAVAWFYAFAASRGVPIAWEALSASLAAFMVVGPHTLELDGLVTPRTWPLLAVAAVQLGLLRHRRESWRGLVAASCIAVASRAGLAADWPAFERDALTFHVVLAAAMLIGAAFDDPLGRRLRRAGAVLLTLAGLVAIVGDPILGHALPTTVALAYPPVAIATGLAFGYLVACRAYYVSAVAVSGTWLASAGWRGYILLRQLVVGLDLIAWGLAFFLLAALISLAKGGVLPRWRWTPHGAPPERVGSP